MAATLSRWANSSPVFRARPITTSNRPAVLLGGTAHIVNGTSIEYSVFTIDGVYKMSTGNLGNINILPVIDSIDVFRILKHNYNGTLNPT